jgi:hypothetical protein
LLRFARNDSENRGDERSSRVPPIVLRAGLCVPVALDYCWRPVAADPDDDIVVETAVNGGADVIATFNSTTCAQPRRDLASPLNDRQRLYRDMD